MNLAKYHLSDNAKNVYEYLLKVKEATKENIIRETVLVSEDNYLSCRNELISKGLVHGKKGRTGGLALVAKESTRVSGLSENARKLLEKIPQDGSFVGNVFLRSSVGISSDEYWEVRKELLEARLIQTGKGRGGSVARTVEGIKLVSTVPKGLAKEENKLYKPLKKWLESTWARSIKESGDYYSVKITATPSGYKRKSGKYSRPDLTFVQASRFDYLPGRFLEVTTFEVKQFKDAQDIKNVYEAAAHLRWANNSYLVVEVPDKEHMLSDRVTSELARFHVGLLVMYHENGVYECDERLEPVTQNPEPKEQDVLLKTFFENDVTERKKFLRAIGK